MVRKNDYITIPELARIIGLSRIAVFKKVKKGVIKAVKIGRNYAIPRSYIDSILGNVLGDSDRREINAAVKKTVKEYGGTLKLLGRG